MATKAEERKALEQIRKIVAGLGTDSYIGFAFEGCFEDAEDNIAGDAAFSYKNRYESAMKQLEEANKEKVKAIEESKLSEQMGQKYFESWQSAEKDIENLEAELETENRKAEKAVTEQGNKILDLGKELKAKDNEIMKLKAKLYDLMKDAE